MMCSFLLEAMMSMDVLCSYLHFSFRSIVALVVLTSKLVTQFFLKLISLISNVYLRRVPRV